MFQPARQHGDIGKFGCTFNLTVTRENLFDERRSGAWHAEHENRRWVEAALCGAAGKQIGGKHSDAAIDERSYFVGVIRHECTTQSVAGRIMAKRHFIIACIFERLAERKMEVETIFLGKLCSVERCAHDGDVISVEFKSLKIGKTPPHLAKCWCKIERAAISGNAVVKSPDCFENMAITHPDFGLAGDLLQDFGI